MMRDLEANHCPGEMFSEKGGKITNSVIQKIRPNCYKKERSHILKKRLLAASVK